MLLEHCTEAVDRALSLEQDEAEAFAQKKHVFVAEFSGGTLSQVVERESQGIGIRSIHEKATGFAYSTDLSDIMVPIRKAVHNSHGVSPDPLHQSLAHPQPILHTPHIFDPSLHDFSTGDIIEILSDLVSGTEQTRGIIQITVRECAISNSHGVSVSYKKSDCSIKCTADPAAAASYCNFSRLDTKSISAFLERESEKPHFPKKRVKWDNRGQIILQPHAVPDFIRPLIMAMNGKNCVEKNSYLTHSKDNEIVSDVISLHDDGLYPNGLFTQPVDGEGISSQKTPLIEKGVLTDFVYDCYYASRAGVESTGNALRQGFKDLPGCMFTNVIVKEGESSYQELIEDTQQGIIINSMGANVVNPRSPRITLSVSRGGLIENGEIVASLFPTLLLGNVLTMLQTPILSKDTNQVFRFIVPWMKIEPPLEP